MPTVQEKYGDSGAKVRQEGMGWEWDIGSIAANDEGFIQVFPRSVINAIHVSYQGLSIYSTDQQCHARDIKH
jgi:hypothetical protein